MLELVSKQSKCISTICATIGGSNTTQVQVFIKWTGCYRILKSHKT